MNLNEVKKMFQAVGHNSVAYGYNYPVRDDIPTLTLDDSRGLSNECLEKAILNRSNDVLYSTYMKLAEEFMDLNLQQRKLREDDLEYFTREYYNFMSGFKSCKFKERFGESNKDETSTNIKALDKGIKLSELEKRFAAALKQYELLKDFSPETDTCY